MNFFRLLIIALSSYCLGAINGSLIVSRYLLKKDIRQYGSRNAGTTNMYRVFGPIAAGMTVAVDVIKSLIAVLFAGLVFHDYPEVGKLFSGFCLMLGHIYPVYYDFKGGKGVLCGAVMLFLFDWRIGLLLLACFIGIVVFTRYVSLGSMAAAGLLPVFTLLFKHGGLCALLTLFCALLVIFMHRQNIGRLVTGKESQFTLKPTKKTSNSKKRGQDSQH